MPGLKLTLRRLADHFRRMAFTYIASCAAACLLAYLLYDALEPRLPNESEVRICYIAEAYDTAAFGRLANELFAALTDGAERPDLRKLSFECFPYGNAAEKDPNMPMILMARLSSGNADLYVASPAAARLIQRTDAWQEWDDWLGGPEGALPLEGALYGKRADSSVCTTALSASRLSVLTERGCAFGTEGAYVFLSSTTRNAEDSVDALKALFAMSREGGAS